VRPHLPDFWKAIALVRLADVLRPGGVLRLWDIIEADYSAPVFARYVCKRDERKPCPRTPS
jgi:hypothetical protein